MTDKSVDYKAQQAELELQKKANLAKVISIIDNGDSIVVTVPGKLRTRYSVFPTLAFDPNPILGFSDRDELMGYIAQHFAGYIAPVYDSKENTEGTPVEVSWIIPKAPKTD